MARKPAASSEITTGTPTAASPLTTAGLQALLAERYPDDRWALFFNVPDSVGVAQNRRADAIAAGLWKTVGHDLHGFELKISRGDWLRELSKVHKADPFLARCDYWWLVTADTSIAKLEELPACWGWLAATRGGLRVQRPAARLPQPADKIDRLFALGLFRKLKQEQGKEQPKLPLTQAAVDAYEERVAHEVRLQVRAQVNGYEQLKARVSAFEQRSGIALDSWRAGRMGDVVRQIMALDHDGGLQGLEKLLQDQARELTDLLAKVETTRQAVHDHAAATRLPVSE